MLNRRILRVKAMQNLYAFQQNKISAYHAGEEQIVNTFTPDWDTEEGMAAEMKVNKTSALAIFKSNFDKDQIILNEEVNAPVKNAVVEARNYYRQQTEKDIRHFRQNIIRYTDNVYFLYLFILQLLPKTADIISQEWQDKNKKQHSVPGVQSETALNLVLNDVVTLLRTHEDFRKVIAEYKVSWQPYLDDLRRWYKERLKQDEQYQKYLTESAPDFNTDQEMAEYIVKKLVLKDDILTPVFESLNICWTEDRKIVKSMLGKSLKSVSKDSNSLELALLSPNWEDDLQYCLELYKYTIEDEKINEEIISKRIKNWEIDRIANIDYILLQMAISEMVHFPNIPIKVTINEFIEISKNYSTPKSKKFINGVLDVIANELTREGKIRKSGRGLIDNK